MGSEAVRQPLVRRFGIGQLLAAVVITGVLGWLVLSADVDSPAFGFGWRTTALLGVVEGVTEYLPISSTGHLAVTAELLWSPASASQAVDSYLIVIQAGAILAVFGLYRHRFLEVLAGLTRGGDGRRLAVAIGVALLPAAAVGVLFGTIIKQRLFGLVPIAWAWIVGGLVVLVADRHQLSRRRNGDVNNLQPLQAGIIGLAQVLALWPGTSRSLVTILGGQAVGLSTRAAVEFSFLLGAVTLLAASIFEGAGNFDSILSEIGFGPALVGLAAATLTAALSVRWLVTYLTSHSLVVFGWYRIVIGTVVLFFLA